MKRRNKILVVSTCALLLIFSFFVLFATAFIARFSNKNINASYDEQLFSLSKQSTVTEYYGNVAHPGEGYKFEKIADVALGDKNKIWVSINSVSDYLKSGFIAVEDREFYNHNGVNLKRTAYAFMNSLFHFKNRFGASTITQQVIKNMSGDNEKNFKRKLSEIIRAYNIEKKHTKDEIFEVYLNIIPMGENIYGVASASDVYFGKSPYDLKLSEAATLVGITNAPTRYNPHANPEECLEKRNDVLFAMYSFGAISEDEYNSALCDVLGVLPIEKSENSACSWFVETVNKDIIYALENELGISYYAAEMLLCNGGLKIYTTQNPKIQSSLEKYFENTSNFSKEINSGLDYSMVVCDSQTGDLLGIVGSVGKKNADKLLNLATVPHTPGSTLKPLALYAPLINSGRINWATVFDDVPCEFKSCGSGYIAYPQNSPAVYDGLTTVKDALRLSKNTVAIRLYNMLGADTIFKNLEQDFGFSTLVSKEYSDDGSVITDIAPSPLALGQLSYGVSLRKLTESYTVFPSDGVINNGRSFVYVYDALGNLILDNTACAKRVYSKECARIMNKLLSNVTESGTASAVTLKRYVDTAGKTGTSGDDKDRLFIGYTPYITAGIWCGYRNSDISLSKAKPNHIKIWDDIMRDIHFEMLATISGNDIRHFSDEGLIKCDYCKDSGKLYSPVCTKDPRGTRMDSGYFTKENAPHGLCDTHIMCEYDFLSEAVATHNCPKEFVRRISLLLINDRHFPKEVVVNDAEFVYFEIKPDYNYGESYDIPYFQNYIPDGEYVGRGSRRKQFNSACYIHSD